MKGFLMRALCSGLLIICFARVANATPHMFNMQKALDYALSHSPDLDKSKRDVQIARLSMQNAYAKLFPIINLKATQGFNNNFDFANDKNINGVNINLEENLYNNGIDRANWRKAKINYQKVLLHYQQQRDKLLLDVASAYLDLSLNVQMHQIEKSNLQLLRKQYVLAQEQYHQGLKLQQDVIRLDNNVRNAELSLLMKHDNVEKEKLLLLKTMGYSTQHHDISLIHFQAIEPNTIRFGVIPKQKPALEEHVVSRMDRMQDKINELDYKIEKRKRWPTLSLDANAGYNTAFRPHHIASFTDGDFTWHLSLTLQYPLWDWGIQTRKYKIAKQKKFQQDDDLTISHLELSKTLNDMMLDLTQHQQSYVISKELLQHEKKSFDYIENEYRNGKVNYLDFINAINEFTKSKTNYMSSLFSLQKSLYTHRYHKGTLYAVFYKK